MEPSGRATGSCRQVSPRDYVVPDLGASCRSLWGDARDRPCDVITCARKRRTDDAVRRSTPRKSDPPPAVARCRTETRAFNLTPVRRFGNVRRGRCPPVDGRAWGAGPPRNSPSAPPVPAVSCGYNLVCSYRNVCRLPGRNSGDGRAGQSAPFRRSLRRTGMCPARTSPCRSRACPASCPGPSAAVLSTDSGLPLPVNGLHWGFGLLAAPTGAPGRSGCGRSMWSYLPTSRPRPARFQRVAPWEFNRHRLSSHPFTLTPLRCTRHFWNLPRVQRVSTICLLAVVSVN